ncbi:MAG: AMP-binding protein, partial [Actinomycetia bacterium]|nr:AMP-binding protein [Actinomycetes bacterium]
MSHNLFELFASRFSDHYHDPFLSIPDQPSHTYADIDHRSAAIAAVLTETGTQVDDRVIAQVDKSIDAFALYLACIRSGFIFVPLNPAYTAEEVGYFIGDAEASTFIFSPDRAAKVQPVGDIAGVANMFTLGTDGDGTLGEAASELSAEPAVVARQADDIACMLYTSGTTGRSKGAMLTHANLASNGLALHTIWCWREGDVLLHALPIFHVHGLFVALHCAMLNSSEVIYLPRFDAEQVRANLSRSTVMMGVPTYYTRLLADPEFGADDCSSIRMFTSGSAPLTPVVFRQFTERTGHTICERYGMTECGIITSNPPEGQRLAGTVGYALPGVEMRVVDDAGQPVSSDEIGQVEVKGPNLFPGYWQLPDKTAEEMTADGFFRTGDIGSMAADGRLALIGRSSDLIISGGYNVYPKEIELLLDTIPGVIESAVVGLPHPDFGEGVVAFVVGDGTLTEADLDDGLADRLARFKQPKNY